MPQEPTTLLRGIAAAAAASPSAPAVVDSTRSLTYRELLAESAAFAADLRAAAGTDRLSGPIALSVPRSAALAVAAIAVLDVGACLFPIDLQLPPDRVERMFARARPRLHVSVDGSGSLSVVSVAPGARPSRGTRWEPHRDAYVLFTSGSTGDPKGIAMPRRPLEHLVEWHRTNDGPALAGATTQLASSGFDVAWQEVFSTLCTGGRLIVPPDQARADPQAILQWVTQYDVRRLFLPTAMLDPMARAVATKSAPTCLQRVFVAGSQLRITQAVRDWFEQAPHCRLHNQYGPAETHVITDHPMTGPAADWEELPPIGNPLGHVIIRVLGKESEHAEPVTGELVIGGDCLSDGYVDRPDLTAERFEERPDGRWYRTGDLVAAGPPLRFLGRLDRMLKVDGHRVEPGEVEAAIARHPGVAEAYVDVPATARIPRLVAYVVPVPGAPVTAETFRADVLAHAARHLAPAAVPRSLILTDRLPLNANGKVDVNQLPAALQARPPLVSPYEPPQGPTEELLTGVWADVLGLDRIGRHDPFFELGGTSLAMLQVVEAMRSRIGAVPPLADHYAHPTIATLAQRLVEPSPTSRPAGPTGRRKSAPEIVRVGDPSPSDPGEATHLHGETIAIVGMACRFPGAMTPREFFTKLFSGADLITRRHDEETSEGTTRIVAAGVLERLDEFDADFFGLSAADATLLDPQHRLFLECCWEALEDASVVADRYPGLVGVYGGTGPSTYLLNNLIPAMNGEPHILVTSASEVSLLTATSQDFLTSRVSYLLDLRGPSVNVNGACATALMALHQAVEDLRSGACDLALAGAASVQVPQLVGYERDSSLPLARDGICRVFDIASTGTVFGNGCGVFALKRLTDAVRDRDEVYAVVLGTGTANDGRQKVGMTAPSVQGQVRAIRRALASGSVDPATVSHLEAHGTGTQVGDPIELAALGEAYGDSAARALGSVKSQVGHLGWAAGMAGLVKAALALNEGVVPPTINISIPNPELLLDQRRMHVVTDPAGMTLGSGTNRIGVNAVGLGGANSHAILQRPPARPGNTTEAGIRRKHFILPVSGRTEQARRDALNRLANEFRCRTLTLPDVARTLALGRRHHEARSAAVVTTQDDVAGALEDLADRVPSSRPGRPVVALFPGHGVEKTGQSRGLYDTEPVFREALHQFDEILQAELGRTVPGILFEDPPGRRIEHAAEVHAVVFATQVSLFRLLESKGVVPDILLGHSLGQYAAAALSGVFAPEDGMRIAVERGHALQDCDPTGTMWSLRCDEATARALLDDEGHLVDLAVVNAPKDVVISGPLHALQQLVPAIEAQGIRRRPLNSLRAGHSRSVQSAAHRLEKLLSRVHLSAPTRTLLSNVSGRVAGEEVARPEYWATHLTSTVRFADCIETIRELDPGPVLQLGMSPGVLGLVASTLEDAGPFLPVLRDGTGEASFAQALGACYSAGMHLDWQAIVAGEGRLAHLPTYPFQRRRYWSGPEPTASPTATADQAARLLHRVAWEPATTPVPSEPLGHVALVGGDAISAARFAAMLKGPAGSGPDVSVVLRPQDLTRETHVSHAVVLMAPSATSWESGDTAVEEVASGIRLVSAAVRMLDHASFDSTSLTILMRGAIRVHPGDPVSASASAVWAMLRSVALERPELQLSRIDADDVYGLSAERLTSLVTSPGEHAVRDGVIFKAAIAPSPGEIATTGNPQVHPDELLIVTGGLGGLGLGVVEHLAVLGARRFLLVGRTNPRPEAEELVRRLAAKGVEVATLACDVTNAIQVDRLVKEVAGKHKRAVRIVHCAGVLHDALVENISEEQLRTVLAPKVGGIVNLLGALLRHDVQVSGALLFSSATAAHGNLGQSVYGAANGFLDGLGQGTAWPQLPITSIGWGIWRSAGVVSQDSVLLRSLYERGLGAIDQQDGLTIMTAALRSANGGGFAVLPNDWTAFRAHHQLGDTSFYSPDVRKPSEGQHATDSRRRPADQEDLPELRARLLASGSPESQVPILAEAIAGLAGRFVPGYTTVTPTTSLTDIGMDSLSLVQMRNELRSMLGCRLPARLLATHSTAQAVAESLIEQGLVTSLSADAAVVGGPVRAEQVTPAMSDLPAASQLSVEQGRWLKLVTEAGYGRRAVPVIIHAPLDASVLHRALSTVIDRHHVLRQFFPDGLPPRLVGPNDVLPDVSELCSDLTDLDATATRVTLGRLIRELLASVPDPRRAPSWAIRAVAVQADLFILLLASEHLQFDGSGLSVFVDETRMAYAGLLRGVQPDLPAVVPYSEYVLAQDVYRRQDIEKDRDWFRALYSGVSGPTRLEGGREPLATVARASRRYTAWEPLYGNWDRDRYRLRATGVSPFSVLLASFGQLAAEITGLSTVCISMIRSHRTDARFAGTIGPFTSPIPVPVHVSGFDSTDLVRQVDDSVQGITERSLYPVTDLVVSTRAFSSLPSDTYFSDFGINYTDYRKPDPVAYPRTEVVEVIGEVQHEMLRGYDFAALRRIPGLHLVATTQADTLQGNYWYHVDRIDDRDVAAWAHAHRRILHQLMRDLGVS